jgi:hypothetical protein
MMINASKALASRAMNSVMKHARLLHRALNFLWSDWIRASARRAMGPRSNGGNVVVGMPGGVVAATSEITATVTAVDAKARKVMLQFVDGTSDIVTVGKAVDLSKVSTGDSVTARLTESIAIAVEKT